MHNGLGSRSQSSSMNMDERRQALGVKNAREEAGQEETWNKIRAPKTYPWWPPSARSLLMFPLPPKINR